MFAEAGGRGIERDMEREGERGISNGFSKFRYVASTFFHGFDLPQALPLSVLSGISEFFNADYSLSIFMCCLSVNTFIVLSEDHFIKPKVQQTPSPNDGTQQ